MKRRRFITALAAAPAAPALLAQQAEQPAFYYRLTATAAAPAPRGLGAQNVPNLEVTGPGRVAEPETRFFNAQQFAALRKVSEILLRPLKGNRERWIAARLSSSTFSWELHLPSTSSFIELVWML